MLFFFLDFLSVSYAETGVQPRYLISPDNIKCLAKENYHFIAIRFANLQDTSVDIDYYLTLCMKLQIRFQLVYTPCFKNQKIDLQSFLENLKKRGKTKQINRIWVEVQNNHGCKWFSQEHQDNCQYIAQKIELIQRYNISVGIQTNKYYWNIIPGRLCNQFSKLPLWYQPDQQQYPNSTRCCDFGGWTHPLYKRQTDFVIKCEIAVEEVAINKDEQQL